MKMAKRQTRRTISINRALFERAKLHAQTVGMPLSQLTEIALCSAIDAGPTRIEASPTQPAPHAAPAIRRLCFMAEMRNLKQKWGIA